MTQTTMTATGTRWALQVDEPQTLIRRSPDGTWERVEILPGTYPVESRDSTMAPTRKGHEPTWLRVAFDARVVVRYVPGRPAQMGLWEQTDFTVWAFWSTLRHGKTYDGVPGRIVDQTMLASTK